MVHLSPLAIETQERIQELNHLIYEGWLELGELHQELASKPNNQDIQDTIRMIKDITRNNINEAKRLENSLANI
jgi:hypothetical protein